MTKYILLLIESDSMVRLATLELAVRILRSLFHSEKQSLLLEGHLAAIEEVREESTLLLRNNYKIWEKVI